MTAYYNEIDPKAAAWLRELIKQRLIADGDVDERSIADVRGDDIRGYTQCHFFAGIGGWSYALRLAGWADDQPVWTGSCPCQPFSAAGKRKGTADERHLWPEFHRLIAECSPPVVFGEQVASKDGRLWLAGVRADLETLGYAVGAADLCAAGVSAPHIRQRLFWMADTDGGIAGARRMQRSGEYGQQPDNSGAMRLADAMQSGWSERRPGAGNGSATRGSDFSRLGDTDEPGSQGWDEHLREHASEWSAWAASELLPCTDGKTRRIEPGSFPLAHGIPARMGRLRGYGNAIVPQIAAEFIAAATDCLVAP